jgi:hypothetical protein
LLLAPIKASGGDAKIRFTRTLDLLAAAEADHELGRLLYVGATRADEAAPLIATAEIAEGTTAWKPPPRKLRAGKTVAGVGGFVAAADRRAGSVADAASNPPPRAAPPLSAAGFALPSLPRRPECPPRVGARSPVVPFEWAHATAAAVGTSRIACWRTLRVKASRGSGMTARVAALGSRITQDCAPRAWTMRNLDKPASTSDHALRNVIRIRAVAGCSIPRTPSRQRMDVGGHR